MISLHIYRVEKSDKAAEHCLEAVPDCLEIPILVLELPDKAMLFEVE